MTSMKGGVITWQNMGEAVSLLESLDAYVWTYCSHTERLVQQQEPHEQREESREERLHGK